MLSLRKVAVHCRNSVEYQVLNLARLKECLDNGSLPEAAVITMKELRDSGTIQRKVKDGVKLLGGVRPSLLDHIPCIAFSIHYFYFYFYSVLHFPGN